MLAVRFQCGLPCPPTLPDAMPTTNPVHRHLLLAASVCLGLALPARAQMYSPGYALSGAPMSNFLSSSYLTQAVVNQLSGKQGAQTALRPAQDPLTPKTLTVPTRGLGTMAAKLAAHYPPAQQAQAQALFEELLRRYAQVEAQFGIPRGDLGGALAALLAGSWMGLHDAPFPDRYFPPVVTQMRALLAAQPGLQDAPEVDRREMYEQLAILGMLMASTQMALQQQPDAATQERLRQASLGYLQQFFKADAERLSFGPDGLRLDGAPLR